MPYDTIDLIYEMQFILNLLKSKLYTKDVLTYIGEYHIAFKLTPDIPQLTNSIMSFTEALSVSIVPATSQNGGLWVA